MSWPTTPTRFVLTEVDERGLRDGERGELLSVSEYLGIIPRSGSASQQAASEDVSQYKRCNPGQLVLNRLWAFRGGLGVSSHTGLVSPDYAVFDIDPQCDPRFVHYQVRSAWFVAEMSKRLRGIGSPDASLGRAPRINVGNLGLIEMHTPPIAVQRRVADLLDAETARIDTLIAKNQRVLETLESRTARLLEDGIFGQDAPPVGIHYLATYVNGYPFKPDDKGPEGLPIVRIAQLLNPDAEVDYYAGEPDAYCHIDTGDLIFSWSGSLAARIWDRGPAYLNQHLFRVLPDRAVDKRWLLHALKAAVPRMHAMTHGSTMTHITRPMMTRIRVPKPEMAQQRTIAARIDQQLDRQTRLAAKVRTQIALLGRRRQALVTAAVTGQIDV